MKVAGVVIVAIVGFLAALLAFMPATLVDRQLDAATGGKLRLADASGTVWEGRGIVTAPGSSWRVPLGFTIAKADILRGMHQLALHPVDGASTPQGAVEPVAGGVRVRDLALDVPAAALLTALPDRGLPAVGGTLSVAAGAFEWSAKDKAGNVDARWRSARLVVGETVAELGNVELALAPRDGRLNGRLANSGGDVRIDGTVVVADNGAVSVDATIAPTPAAPASVTRALAAIGTPDATGTIRIAWRGTLR